MHKSLLAAAAACLAVPAIALAAPPTDKVTGGGQILVPQDGGAGDTIAFVGQSQGAETRGQFQYVDRPSGVARHGVIDCLVVDGNEATFAGAFRNAPGDRFEVTVIDGGPGADAILFSDANNGDCERADGNGDELVRGNATVHQAKD